MAVTHTSEAVANIDEAVSNVSESIEILKSETGKHDIDIKILSHKLNKKHNG